MSLFHLPTRTEELESSNHGIAKSGFDQIAPQRAIEGANFTKGQIRFRWENESGKWWVPKNSYIRARLSITHADGSPVQTTDEVAPQMNLGHSLFKSMEFTLGDKTVCKVSDYLHQVSTLDTRLDKSKAWLDSVGKSTDFWDSNPHTRMTQISEDGRIATIDDYQLYEQNYTTANINFNADTIYSYTSTTGEFLIEQTTAGNPLFPTDDAMENFLLLVRRKGVRIGYQQVGTNGTIDNATVNLSMEILNIKSGAGLFDQSDIDTIYSNYDEDGTALRALVAAKRSTFSAIIFRCPKNVHTPGGVPPIGTGIFLSVPRYGSEATRQHQGHKRSIVDGDSSKHANNFEVIFQPCLSVFKLGHALPCGKYELILNPHSVSDLTNAAIQSLIPRNDISTLYKINVHDMYFYANTLQGMRTDNLTYLLDLTETSLQTRQLLSKDFSMNQFDVSPSSYALTVAYQSSLAGSNAYDSRSLFRASLPDGQTLLPRDGFTQEQRLTRFYLNYAGVNQPSPDADPAASASSADGLTGGVQYLTQRYGDSLLNAGLYSAEGGAESLDDYLARGLYLHFRTDRDATDRSSVVRIHQQFTMNSQVSNLNVLLFDHYRKVARVTIQDGRVVNVEVEDV